MADPERFDADPDPPFQADADPELNPLTRVRKKFFIQLRIRIQILLLG